MATRQSGKLSLPPVPDHAHECPQMMALSRRIETPFSADEQGKITTTHEHAAKLFSWNFALHKRNIPERAQGS